MPPRRPSATAEARAIEDDDQTICAWALINTCEHAYEISPINATTARSALLKSSASIKQDGGHCRVGRRARKAEVAESKESCMMYVLLALRVLKCQNSPYCSIETAASKKLLN